MTKTRQRQRSKPQQDEGVIYSVDHGETIKLQLEKEHPTQDIGLHLLQSHDGRIYVGSINRKKGLLYKKYKNSRLRSSSNNNNKTIIKRGIPIKPRDQLVLVDGKHYRDFNFLEEINDYMNSKLLLSLSFTSIDYDDQHSVSVASLLSCDDDDDDSPSYSSYSVLVSTTEGNHTNQQDSNNDRNVQRLLVPDLLADDDDDDEKEEEEKQQQKVTTLIEDSFCWEEALAGTSSSSDNDSDDDDSDTSSYNGVDSVYVYETSTAHERMKKMSIVSDPSIRSSDDDYPVFLTPSEHHRLSQEQQQQDDDDEEEDSDEMWYEQEGDDVVSPILLPVTSISSRGASRSSRSSCSTVSTLSCSTSSSRGHPRYQRWSVRNKSSSSAAATSMKRRELKIIDDVQYRSSPSSSHSSSSSTSSRQAKRRGTRRRSSLRYDPHKQTSSSSSKKKQKNLQLEEEKLAVGYISKWYPQQQRQHNPRIVTGRPPAPTRKKSMDYSLDASLLSKSLSTLDLEESLLQSHSSLRHNSNSKRFISKQEQQQSRQPNTTLLSPPTRSKSIGSSIDIYDYDSPSLLSKSLSCHDLYSLESSPTSSSSLSPFTRTTIQSNLSQPCRSMSGQQPTKQLLSTRSKNNGQLLPPRRKKSMDSLDTYDESLLSKSLSCLDFDLSESYTIQSNQSSRDHHSSSSLMTSQQQQQRQLLSKSKSLSNLDVNVFDIFDNDDEGEGDSDIDDSYRVDGGGGGGGSVNAFISSPRNEITTPTRSKNRFGAIFETPTSKKKTTKDVGINKDTMFVDASPRKPIRSSAFNNSTTSFSTRTTETTWSTSSGAEDEENAIAQASSGGDNTTQPTTPRPTTADSSISKSAVKKTKSGQKQRKKTATKMKVSKSFCFSPNDADVSNDDMNSPTTIKPGSVSKLAVKKKIQRSSSDPFSGGGVSRDGTRLPEAVPNQPTPRRKLKKKSKSGDNNNKGTKDDRCNGVVAESRHRLHRHRRTKERSGSTSSSSLSGKNHSCDDSSSCNTTITATIKSTLPMKKKKYGDNRSMLLQRTMSDPMIGGTAASSSGQEAPKKDSKRKAKKKKKYGDDRSMLLQRTMSDPMIGGTTASSSREEAPKKDSKRKAKKTKMKTKTPKRGNSYSGSRMASSMSALCYDHKDDNDSSSGMGSRKSSPQQNVLGDVGCNTDAAALAVSSHSRLARKKLLQRSMSDPMIGMNGRDTPSSPSSDTSDRKLRKHKKNKFLMGLARIPNKSLF